MDIRLCYEAGAVLFWLLFAYLFMDKFLFRGAAWRDMFREGTPPHGESPAGCGRLVRSRERGTEERTRTGERENGQERDSGSRENARERASTRQDRDEAHGKDSGEKQ